jgi:hypothetical protein
VKAALLALLILSQAPTVGRTGELRDLILPGGELEVLPGDSTTPLVVRLTAVRPHGEAFRYDVEYWAREAGSYDLRDFLRRVDGSPLDAGPGALAPIPLEVGAVLPPGRVLPNEPPASFGARFGGYTRLLWVGGGLWLAGLGWILFAGRRRAARAAAAARPRTLAEVLRPLVERARAGTLSVEERSRLELALVALWRRRLGLERERPEEALARLRAHAEAGPLFTSLEAWLHAPAIAQDVDVEALLAPYRDLAPEALERAPARG